MENRSLVPPTNKGGNRLSTSLDLEKTETATDAEYDPTTYDKPYSPFYIHPSARPSMERSKSSNHRIEIRGASNDLEAGLNLEQSNSAPSKQTDDGAVKEGKPFVSWRRGHSECKKNQGMTWPKARRCNCLAALPKWQRITIKLLIALLVVGAIVGLAVGISIAVHGTVYKSNSSTAPIGG